LRFIGLDAGSVSVKVVVLDERGEKLAGRYKKHSGHPVKVAHELLSEVASPDCSISVTGSAGRLIASILGVEPLNEIVAGAYSTKKLYPHIRSVIEMGGEDSKLIALGEGLEDFSMNSVCAAGTGSFLDQQAERLRLTIEEMSELALKSEKPPRIAGRCSVFAKSDMIHLQQIATPVHDIVAGLCFAVARNFKGSICRGRQIKRPVSFQGGVAANKGMVWAFREVLELDELFVPPDFALMGAWGAALKAKDEGLIQRFDLSRLEKFLGKGREEFKGHSPLMEEGDDFLRRHAPGLSQPPLARIEDRVNAYMGIDIGSISTNLALTDDEGNLLAKRYLMTAGRPIEAVMQGLREIAHEVGDKVYIAGVGTTGSGRYMIADYVGADIVKNEITAQATAAAFIDKRVDTIFEIGGQDSKFISLRDGVITDFEMNKACAAGTGSFLEEQAEKLDISIKEEFARKAFSSKSPLKLGERCTVFMENSLMANLQKGANTDDLLAGLAYSIVQNYINRVVAGKPIGENIFFQGGVAFNKSVVAAFEKYLDKKVTVPPHHDVTGAIGMALIARDHMKASKKEASTFKGFSLSERPYEVASFECKGCPNVCEINRVKIEGEQGHLFFGGRCEKYDIRRKKDRREMPDLFALREELMRGLATQSQGAVPPPAGAEGPISLGAVPPSRPRIGIPYIFFYHDLLPFWVTFLKGLGLEPVVSPQTDRAIINLGLESVLSEACFPVKVAHGHIRYLMNSGVDAVLLPSGVNINRPSDEYERGVFCPYVQTIPYVTRVALRGLKAVSPVINTSLGKKNMIKELQKAFGPFGAGRIDVEAALEDAGRAQEEFEAAIREKGREVLKGIEGKTSVVIVGRSYNAFERGMNLEIPQKLASLGVLAIPMDFLPLGDIPISGDWPNMYWRSGQRILKAARFISKAPGLYPIFIGNFSCGPDSFILKYFRKELAGKPFLHIEIDEHSADAGAITRCEAFLDSISGAKRSTAVSGEKASLKKKATLGRKMTVYIPRMSDHAYALEAAFEASGVPAEALPEPDRETVDMGMKYVSGKECYPCVVTTGDMLKKVFSPDFRPEDSAFFMPSGTGPCRFGQYNVFHKQVLEDIGLPDIPIFAPNQDAGFYNDLGMVGKDFAMRAWKGIASIDLLYKCLHETRPYEKEKGLSDALYTESLNKLRVVLRGANGGPGGIEGVLKKIRRDFEAVPEDGERKPLIGIIGEIFVRSSRFSNEDLIRKIEAMGGEAWLAPVEEWIYYVNYTGGKKAKLERDIPALLDIFLKRFFQKKVEHRYGACFEGFLKTLHEPSTKDLIKKAGPYVHESFEGETILSLGKAMDLAERGAGGIVNAMPFGCMPGTIVTALMRGLSSGRGIPVISIPYDGTESPTVTIQLEAFMEQARGLRAPAHSIE